MMMTMTMMTMTMMMMMMWPRHADAAPAQTAEGLPRAAGRAAAARADRRSAVTYYLLLSRSVLIVVQSFEPFRRDERMILTFCTLSSSFSSTPHHCS